MIVDEHVGELGADDEEPFASVFDGAICSSGISSPVVGSR